MLKIFIKLAAVALVASFGTIVSADTWTLDSENSKLAFGSIKKDKIGEVHSFERISGTVSDTGAVAINIDLTSVQTNIEIRDTRMVEHVFKGMADASLAAQIDMAAVSALGLGETTVIDVAGTLSLVGTNVDIETEMFVARLSESTVVVTTNDMIFLNLESAGIDASVTKLMEIAKLPSITRTSPVTLRLVFNSEMTKAEVAPAAPAAQTVFAGDVKKGKKIFKKCKACHSMKPGKNGVGPSLHSIIGKQSGAADGYKYSKAMKGANITWDAANLNTYLTKPKTLVPGTKMSFGGLKKAKDIENLLSYIQAESK